VGRAPGVVVRSPVLERDEPLQSHAGEGVEQMPRFGAGWAAGHPPDRCVVFPYQYAGRSSAAHKVLFLAGHHMHDDLGMLAALVENIWRDMLDHLDVVAAVVLEEVGLDL